MLVRFCFLGLVFLNSACALLVRKGSQEEIKQITVQGQVRRYILHVPASYDAQKKTALVVVLHGGGGNGRNAEKMSGFSAKADKEGFIVVYPYGSGRLDERLLTWNAGNCCGYALDKNVDDVAFIRELVVLLKRQYSIDDKQIFATGMSNGGMMTHRLACELSDVFSGVAPVSGAMNVPVCNPARAVSMVIFHGKKDEHVLFEGGVPKKSVDSHPRVDKSVAAAVEFWKNRNVCTQSPTESHGKIQIEDFSCAQAGLAVYAIEDEGHTWPGGEKGYFAADEPTREISATDVMWDFWQKNLRP